MAGDAAQLKRPWIVHLAGDPLPVAQICRGGPFALFATRAETGIDHAEWSEYLLLCKLVEGNSRQPLDQLAQDDITHITVTEARARFRLGRQLIDTLQALGPALPIVRF